MKIEKLCEQFLKLNVDGVVIISEYNRCYMINFIGFVGVVIIFEDKVVFVIDFCYVD